MRITALIGCLFLGVLNAGAQYSEIGFHGGSSYYIGDLNPYTHFTHYPRFGGGAYVRTNLTDRHAVRFNFLYTSVEAHDEGDVNAWRANRNLHFRSDIIELSMLLEINFFSYEIGDRDRPYTPYVFGGLAYFRMNPQAQFNDRWVELHPLGTEGQNRPNAQNRYALGQFAIPFGMGFKMNISGRVGVALEYGFRMTFTDYLDDVSGTYVDPDLLMTYSGPAAVELADRSLVPGRPDGTNTGMSRGNPDNNDWYAYTNLSITIRLGPVRIKCPKPN
ncbi:MAG: hypothetical protein EA392_04440 [Cryomorphaceae bacterium]|nr:MAG: hypothetical protein EA392_04440 [Cryomorphaceae bacterium]